MSDDTDSKACSKCATVYLLSEFTPMPRKADGRHSWCRPCLRVLARKNYDPDRARARHAAKKDDPEYIAKKKAIYNRWRAEHPDRASQAALRWRANNAEHAAAVRSRWEAQSEDRRLKRRSYSRARDAAKRGGTVTRVEYAAILMEHGMVCHICGGEIASRADLHFDHVIPLAKGGPHVAENIRPAHAKCNMRKGARAA